MPGFQNRKKKENKNNNMSSPVTYYIDLDTHKGKLGSLPVRFFCNNFPMGGVTQKALNGECEYNRTIGDKNELHLSHVGL